MSNDAAILHSTFELGALHLRNRFVMAPMTRLRVDDAHIPLPFVSDYYRQRAGAGLIVSEGLAAAPHGAGYPPMPVLRTVDQIEAWRRIVRTVHAAGGVIMAQLWHVGHPHADYENDERPIFWAMNEPVMPDALSSAEIAAMPRDFMAAAQAALDAGFDGIEVHNGNGMLLDRFLREDLNRRADGYGRDIAGRIRLTLEIIDAVMKVWPADRVGIKFEPNARINVGNDRTDAETFAALLTALEPRGLAYLHLVRPAPADALANRIDTMSLDWFRPRYPGKIIAGGGFGLEEASHVVAAGKADAIVFGKLFLANPDLQKRFQRGAALNVADPATFYTSGPEGLVDYPSLADSHRS